MSETKQISTITEVSVDNTLLDIFTYYDASFEEFLIMFIREVLGVVGNVNFAEGELGYTIQGLPDTSFTVNDNGELIVNDLDSDLYDIDGVGELIYDEGLDIPVAVAASDIGSFSFIANWEFVLGATKYYIDVSLDPQFNTYITGYQNLDVGNVNEILVEGLLLTTQYYYRVRAYDGVQTSEDSNIVNCTTSSLGSIVLIGTKPSGLILKSIDGGLTFTNEGTLAKGIPISFCQLVSGDVFYGTLSDGIIGGYVCNYTDGTFVLVDAINTEVSALDSYDNYIFARAGNDYGSLYYSSDGGASFSRELTLLGGLYSHIVAISATVCLTSSSTALLKRTIGGPSVTVLSFPITSLFNAGGGVIYAGSTNGHIYKSIDFGDSWTDLGNKGFGYETQSIVQGADGRFLFIGDDGSGEVDHYFHVCYTDDDFVTVTVGEYIPVVRKLIQIEDRVLLALGFNCYVYRSIDNGESWVEIDNNPQQGEVESWDFMNFIL